MYLEMNNEWFKIFRVGINFMPSNKHYFRIPAISKARYFKLQIFYNILVTTLQPLGISSEFWCLFYFFCRFLALKYFSYH